MFGRFKNLRLLEQFILPMIVVGGVVIFSSIYSAVMLQQSINALGDLEEYGDQRLRVIEDIESTLAYFRALGLRHMASESAVDMRSISAEILETDKTIQKYFERITTELVDDHPVSLEETQTVLHMTQGYVDEIREVLELSADFEKEEAFIHMTRAEDRYLSFINTSLRALKRHEFEDLSTLRSSLNAAVERNLKITLAIGIAGGLVILIIAFVVTRRITLRLDRLLEWSKLVSSGNLSAEIEAGSHDEVGLLTSAMNKMARNIQIAQEGINDAKHRAEVAAEELQIYANAFDNSGEAMLISDKDNRIINVNAAFTRDTGYQLDEVLGKDPKILSSGQNSKDIYQEMWQDLNDQGFWQGELWDRRKDGKIFPKLIVISAIHDSQGKVIFYMSSFTDISERKAAEKEIERLAHHDILTGLLNRFSMESHLEQAISSAHREDQKLAVLFIDLDRFKDINDSLGHHAGDELLVKVGKRLKLCVRDSDVVSRIGGDEFVVVSTGIRDNSHAAVLAEKILVRISMPYEIGGNEIMISPSIGISVYPEDGLTVDDLMKKADVAMYHSKDMGRNTYQYFTETMLEAANKRITIEREMRVALKSEQMVLHYQPQLSSDGLKVVSLEALVRWDHPEQGIIPPDLFIPIAEETGLIHELGRWVIDESVRQLTQWHAAGLTDFRVAINLSVKQLQSDLLCQDISNILRRYKKSGEELELEITETAAMDDPDLAVRQLNDLRNLGVSLSIDDFGTGYSSLAYLKRLPINTLKLDRSFVRDIETDQSDAEICMASITLAHNLGLKVVAEGVETEAQREFLASHQCDYLQGYLFSRPLPAEGITELLTSKAPLVSTQ
ncbi:MAG: EAL domain-containing protein [Gammaproteobacteria bacterium]|nr:EAL domain-containing protein [Gammaproteobacteria bacterium]